MTLTKAKISEEAFRESFLYDFYATKLLADEEFKDYLVLIISKALKRDVEEIERDFEYLDMRVGLSRKKVDSEADIVLKTGIGYVSIEVNWTLSKNTIKKNMSYVFALYLSQLETAEDYDKLEDVYQINLNRQDNFGKGKFIYRSSLMEEELKIPRKHNMLQIIDINIDYLKKISYTTIKEKDVRELEKILYLFATYDYDRLKELYGGDDLMSKVMERGFRLAEGLERFLLYDKQALRESNLKEEFQRVGREEGLEIGHERGLEEGREMEKQRILEAGKSLYEAGTTIEVILESLKMNSQEEKEFRKMIE